MSLVLFRVLTVKSVVTFASPPARRHRALPVEPFVFAALLMVLTLGINVAVTEADTHGDTAQQAAPAEQTAPDQTALAGQLSQRH